MKEGVILLIGAQGQCNSNSLAQRLREMFLLLECIVSSYAYYTNVYSIQNNMKSFHTLDTTQKVLVNVINIIAFKMHCA